MSQPRRKPNRSRRSQARRPDPIEFWRTGPGLGDAPPVHLAEDPTVVLRSLGAPPVAGHDVEAERSLAVVLVRAAGLAAALGASVGLLEQPGDDDGVGATSD